MILELIAHLRERTSVSIVLVAHNYAHVLELCDRVNLIEDGGVVLDEPAYRTSVEELTSRLVASARPREATASSTTRRPAAAAGRSAEGAAQGLRAQAAASVPDGGHACAIGLVDVLLRLTSAPGARLVAGNGPGLDARRRHASGRRSKQRLDFGAAGREIVRHDGS